MTGAASKLTKFLDEAGCDDQAKRYVAERKIISTEIFASLADTADELDMVLLEPLKAEFKFSDGSAFKPDQLKVLKAPPPATVAPSRASKELAAGYWEAQIAKYESKLVGSEPRVFPQEMLLGAEAIVARVANEMKTGVHTAIALHEIVQNRYFNAAHDPNPLCSAKKRARQQTTVLTINAENQLEAEEESPWQPKSVLAFIDCVESIKFLMILVELGPESSVVMRTLWESSPLLSGPGVPTSADSFDLSDIDDPWLHWQCAAKLVHEGQTSPQLEPGLAQWLPLWRHWRLRLPEIRASVAAEIAQLVSDSDEEIREWFCARAPHVQSAYGGTAERCTVKVPIIKRIAKEFGWADMALFDELDNGFPLLGPLRPGLGWRTRQDARYASPTGMNEFLSENRKVVKRKLRSCKVDPCWEVMAKEIADDVLRGRMEGPFSAPPEWNKTFVPLANFEHTAKLLPGPQTHVPCCFAFAVHQTGSDGQPKVRRAEDWKRSGANGTVGVDDTPCYHDISAFVALAKTIRKVVPDETVQIWGVDHESAYRQLPVEEPEHTYVILQTPYGPTLWRHTVLMFGSTASVWSYCRVADLMTWLSRSLLLVPLLHFVDDFGSCETEITANSAFQCTQDVCSHLGVKFKESKAQPPAQRHVIQGVELELSHDLAQIKCTPERRTRMDCVLLQMLLDDTLKPAEAAAVAGKLQFIAKSLFGKASAAAIRPFYQRASADWLCKLQKGWKLNAALKSAIAFLRHCFRHSPPRSVRFQAAPRSVIYADAFFQLGEQLFKIKDADAAPDWGDANPAAFLNGWGFVAKVGEKVMYASGFVPFWFVRHFASRRSYIYMLEIVAQILPLYALVKDLDPYCIMFVDNEPARHALRKGYGRDEHINRLVQTAWLWIERCGMVPQWQRVMSSANISDAVSRGDFREAERQGWTRLHVDWDNIFAALLDQCLDGPFRWAEG